MLRSLLMASVLAVAFPDASTDPLSLPSPVPEELQLLARASSTRFVAINAATTSQLLVFGDSQGALAQLLLAPGETFDASFPAGTLDGLFMEALVFSGGGWTRSGALSFDDINTEGVDALYVEAGPNGTQAWLVDPIGRVLVESSGTLLPPQFESVCSSSSQPLILEPLHTPVLTPADAQQGEVAPKLERDPLPPV
jgi:hypothetical protein